MSEEKLKVVVQRREIQGHGVLVLDLVAPQGGQLPPFEAGAHVDLHLGEGLVRQYSLCGDPAEREVYRLGILKDPGSRGGSLAAHECLQEGREVVIGLPRNHFPLVAGEHHSILIGGGIGITPMIAMAHALHAAGKSFELHYCGRSEAACAFLDELRSGAIAGKLRTHFDDGAAEQRLDLSVVFGQPAAGAHIYVCGPAGFMDWVIAEAQGHAYPSERVHKEYFQVEADVAGKAFDVVTKRSGKRITVGERESIVDALAKVGIKVKVSCEQGICGTCLCGVIDGEPEHRDVFLTEDEREDNDQIILCCSRAKSDVLVLDI